VSTTHSLLLIVLAACGSCRATDAPLMRQRPPLVWPVAFRVETVLYDLPLDRARELVPRTDPAQDALGYRIDEQELSARLAQLASAGTPADAAIRRAERPDIVAAPGKPVRIPPRCASRTQPAQSLDSDALDMDVRILLSSEWQICNLVLGLTWSRAGAAPMRASQADSPMPEDLWLEFDMLPASAARAPSARALIGFVRAVPIWPETGDL
jgi:hypothetical protein